MTRIQNVIQQTGDDDPYIRMTACEGLSRPLVPSESAPDALRALTGALDDEDFRVRDHALYALQSFGHDAQPFAGKKVLDLLFSDDRYLRETISPALVSVGAPVREIAGAMQVAIDTDDFNALKLLQGMLQEQRRPIPEIADVLWQALRQDGHQIGTQVLAANLLPHYCSRGDDVELAAAIRRVRSQTDDSGFDCYLRSAIRFLSVLSRNQAVDRDLELFEMDFDKEQSPLELAALDPFEDTADRAAARAIFEEISKEILTGGDRAAAAIDRLLAHIDGGTADVQRCALETVLALDIPVHELLPVIERVVHSNDPWVRSAARRVRTVLKGCRDFS